MKYYLDITLLPDAESSLGYIWQKVYQQVHIAIVNNKTQENQSAVALSFPKYMDNEFPLGNTLRLLAETKAELEVLNISGKLNRLTDYIHCKSIQEVDKSKVTKFVCFKRKQFKSPSRIAADVERRAKYLANKEGKDISTVKTSLLELTEKYNEKCNLPFINVMSLSSKKNVPLSEKDRFPLFIEMQVMEEEIDGNFTCYGLSQRESSKQATVPWF